jgi:hypothetical protein
MLVSDANEIAKMKSLIQEVYTEFIISKSTLLFSCKGE